MYRNRVELANSELCTSVQPEINIIQQVIQRKLQLFGCICKMSESKKIKLLTFGTVDERSIKLTAL